MIVDCAVTSSSFRAHKDRLEANCSRPIWWQTTESFALIAAKCKPGKDQHQVFFCGAERSACILYAKIQCDGLWVGAGSHAYSCMHAYKVGGLYGYTRLFFRLVASSPERRSSDTSRTARGQISYEPCMQASHVDGLYGQPRLIFRWIE